MEFRAYHLFLALLMLVTGSINTIATQYANIQESVGRDGALRLFHHPFLESCGMFLGELSCLSAFYYFLYAPCCSRPASYLGIENRTNRRIEDEESNQPPNSYKFNPLIFLPPAMCDLCGTSLMYIGLLLTYPSSYQMLRGSVIVFTAIVSIIFLKRRIVLHQWLGIVIIISGLVVVGLSDVLFPDGGSTTASSPLLGDVIVIIAQLVASFQMVLEEKFVSGKPIHPLQAVGWEGFFGFIVLSILLVPFYYIHVGPTFSDTPPFRLEDALDGFTQIRNNFKIPLFLLLNIVSIAFFNFAGISVTKEMSATTRMVIDTLRTFIVWIYSLAVGWEDFQYLQPIGFILLVCGTCVYNNLVFAPLLARYTPLGKYIGNDVKIHDESINQTGLKSYPDAILAEERSLLNDGDSTASNTSSTMSSDFMSTGPLKSSSSEL